MSEATLEKARKAYARRAWRAAREAYAALPEGAPLTLDDLERHAVAAHLIGEEWDCRDALTRGYRRALELHDATRAARFAFYLGHGMIFTGEQAQANGWFGRARSLLADLGADCVEWGYLLIPAGVDQLAAGDAEAACRTFREAQAIGRRFADASLVAAAGHGHGRALLRLGLVGEGLAALDEAMVAVAAGDVTPLLVGHIYCGVLEACQEVFDIPRAKEWTAVFSHWCEGQPDLVPYRGPCLVHRVEVMRLRGDWEDALEEARRACDWLSLPASPEGPADAFYQLGELCRLRGDGAGAEEAYQQASRLGRTPQPGLALLWLARGRAEEAATAVRRALDEPAPEGPLGDWERLLHQASRADFLSAYVEVLLALGDVAAARAAAVELAQAAAAIDALPLRALADRAEGSVLIAEGQPRAALASLRRSWTAWQRLEAPYEAARVRVLIGEACRALGDEQSAAMEFDAARWAFERLGAAPDLARLDEDALAAGQRAPGGLTPREVEVLRLIAAGETNKGIAAALVISEHTVARHVQNMLQKLGLSSRASLAAYAVRQGLAQPATGQH
ncbi:Transcriptional regulatory protein DegU [bacterium HR29]|jgi:DNA-binding CsgD family transcriptional regulator|nr:Transcriptional regulatory protein DegU [bacterium HR29]